MPSRLAELKARVLANQPTAPFRPTGPKPVAKTNGEATVEKIVPLTVSQQSALARGVMPSNPPAPTSPPKAEYNVPGEDLQHPLTRKDY